jgi:putative spermidine/putrescine transport system substrate-binding protein
MTSRLTRRRTLGLLGGGLLAVSGKRALGQSSAGSLVVASLGGSFEATQRKAVFDPFQKATGIDLKVVAYSNPSQVAAQQKTGNIEWDAILIAKGAMLPLVKQGYFEKIDYGRIAKEDVAAIQPQSLLHDYGVPNIVFSRGIAYNTKLITPGKHPRTWEEVWDVKKYPGQRSLGAFSGSLTPDLEFALIADGVAPEKLYPLDVDRAFKSLDRIRPHVAKFWTTGAVSPQLLVDGEASVASAYMNRIGDLIATGAPVAMEWNQAELQIDYWCVLKGARNRDNALKLIAFATRADIQAAWSAETLMGPANSAAFKRLPPERARMLPSSPENLAGQFIYNDEWWAEHYRDIQRRWEQWSLQR